MEGAVLNMESLTDPHCAAKPGEIYVIYIPEGNNGKSIEIRNLAEKSYKAQWFNPGDGSSSNISGGDSVDPNPAGEWNSPPIQDNEDWVLCLFLA